MTFDFKLSLSLSTAEIRPLMSNRAKEIAESVNQRQAQQHAAGDLQLHRHRIIQAKAPAFWDAFKKTAQEECSDYNNALQDDNYRIEDLDTHIPYTLGFHVKNGGSARIIVDPLAQAISISGKSPIKSRGLDAAAGLKVDEHDNVRMVNADDQYTSASDLVLQVLGYLAAA